MSVCNVGALWPNGWIDQDATWCGGRPQARRHCVRWKPRSPPQNGAQQPPLYGPCLLWPNGWMHQNTTWYRGRPRQHCVTWGPSCPPRKGTPQPATFRPVSIVAYRSPISVTAAFLLLTVGKFTCWVTLKEEIWDRKVYYHIRQLHCIRPYVDSTTACTIAISPSFTPNLITVILFRTISPSFK